MQIQKYTIEPLNVNTLDDASELRDRVFPDLQTHERDTLSASLYKDKYKECWRINELTSLEYFVMIDTEKNNVIGLTGIYTEVKDNENACWLGWFCLEESYRGQGLSNDLLEFSINIAKQKNKKYLHLYTSDSTSYIPTIALYKKYHFTIYDRDGRDIYYKLNLKETIYEHFKSNNPITRRD